MSESGDRESFQYDSDAVVKKVKELIHEGNVRRIIVKNSQGLTIMEFPLTAGVIGVVAAPMIAAVGALAAIGSKWTIEVERTDDKGQTGDESPTEAEQSEPPVLPAHPADGSFFSTRPAESAARVAKKFPGTARPVAARLKWQPTTEGWGLIAISAHLSSESARGPARRPKLVTGAL
jgi:hypothetical protein